MRVLRVLVGVLLLMIAVPTLLVGAGAWYAMQHRDSHGDFRASLQTMSQPGFAVVVPDLDALLRRDAPFTRAGRTGLTVSAYGGRQLFLGLAAPTDVAGVLGSAGYTRIDQVRLGRGPLSVRSTAMAGTGRPLVSPPQQAIWLRAGTNELSLDPSAWRGKNVALVVAAADGEPLGDLTIIAALDPLWLNSTTWGLLILGPVVLLLGFAVLAWPTRPRPVLYVLETVPTASAAQTKPAGPQSPKTPPAAAIPAQNAATGAVPTGAADTDAASGLIQGADTPGAIVPGAAVPGAAVPLAIPGAVIPSTLCSETGLPRLGKPRFAAKRDEGGDGPVGGDGDEGGDGPVGGDGNEVGDGDIGGEGVAGAGDVAVPQEDLPVWPLAEGARRTERAVDATTAELPLVVIQSPLDIPTAEMPLVGPPVRMRLSK